VKRLFDRIQVFIVYLMNDRRLDSRKKDSNSSSSLSFEMAEAVAFVHPNAQLHFSVCLLLSKRDLFADDPALASVPYHRQSEVSVSDFRDFVSALEGATVKVTSNTFRGFSQLSQELYFRDLATQLSQFRASEEIKKDAEAQIPIPLTEINHSGAL
jgi:hypothetical protein